MSSSLRSQACQNPAGRRASVQHVRAFNFCKATAKSSVVIIRVASPRRVAPNGVQRSSPRLVYARSDLGGSLKETAALDDLIDQLLSAKSQQQMAQLVAEHIIAIDTKFWMRIATRNDTAATKDDRERLQAVANSVMVLVDAVRRRTEQQLEDSGKVLQDILVAAADEKGEWYLPLTAEQVQRVRDALERHSSRLDEALLSNAFAWIKKSSEDGFDGMVQLLQLVLQLYAARELRSPETQGVDGALNKLLYSEERQWYSLIRSLAAEGAISEASFMEALQRRMEGVVLGLQSGSYAQRVQAEYLKEVESRAKAVFKELAAASKVQQQN
ncbi:hypothetical protein VOLCADRAFT_103396 [Volvox carteri f. nagariensis]|uniref:Uncharacterized protein n=1 Tax=Volvox carteri f. nagariensis TaxID=3068 RepID=D8TLK9_VOLCA|nr:uncharacterized protein VOLCADRAFT_103396 [Volvox carteri f. nagariensis]EFJ51753.1 hypothetical protein VOLCADRAFT_103396 [Volvox carteri f. nagariensis]|eukprot:XP_002947163.1 hypothetical protein VOLCADRAFT_103396 [Volvox carteri f. nagariensis]